ncbi:MAG: N-acetylglucosaminyl-diphospho-decaprenol L-rhamnosyltransferase [Cellvibrionaceae bacterium]|jgi:N-acetylglucosaminyl-diphospho-decaprenol L-rhamnosyltransferase
MIDLSIVIVSWNVRSYLADCLRSVFAELNHSNLRGEVWVIDNDSTDGTVDMVRNLFPEVRLIVNEGNPGFGAANNQGMKAADPSEPRYHFLLNPDTVVRSGAFGKMVAFMDTNQNVGMTGARLVYGDGRFQHSAFEFPRIGQLLFDLFPVPSRLYESKMNGRYPRKLYDPNHKAFPIDHPLGATMLVRRDVAQETGGFDEMFFMYCEELDWCRRIHAAGWDIYTVPAAEIVHYGGESTRQVPARSIVNLWESRARFYQRHYGVLVNKIASYIVCKGMKLRIRNTAEPEFVQAYQEVVSIWSRPTKSSDSKYS